ncbi:DddA-like double-stranded DNA deaminase toxin [Kribbella sp. NPDC051718]|uniref:DddA-like double-stranded DNA deaminase toxin n=1 Tax=Kribbella sp. NPDC051718 TaxID=3155168 RepID=UPI00342C64DD
MDYLLRTAQKCRQNAEEVGHLSNSPAAQVAAMQLDEAARRCEEASRYLAQAAPKARDWADRAVGGGRPAEPAGGSIPQSRSVPARRTPPEDRRQNGNPPKSEMHGEVADRNGQPDAFEPVAREILERLPRREPTDKTRGIWIDADGHEHELISGVDEYTTAVDQFMVEHRIRIAPGADTLGSHVEVKFALRMRREGLADATITINNKPCPGPYGCHRNLWRFLPDGARLTVYGPDNFKRTYPE